MVGILYGDKTNKPKSSNITIYNTQEIFLTLAFLNLTFHLCTFSFQLHTLAVDKRSAVRPETTYPDL